MPRQSKKEEITGFTFDLFGEEWRVELTDAPLEDADLGHVSGLCDTDNNRIVLERHPSKDFLRKVFFHEFTHAVISGWGTHNLKGKEGWIPEESVVEMIGKAMNQLIIQSHMVPRWLFNRG